MNKFEKLGLSREVLDVLDSMNITVPSEIQEKAIPLILAGHDIIGGSKTGSGKTLAFSSGIIENLKPAKYVQALILAPTRELAQQVADSIKKFSGKKKLNVLAVYGGANIDPQIRRLGTTDVVVGTPGRVLDHINRKTLRLDHIKFLVLDEVDRMFDMGFYKDVERILKECPKRRQTMLFSATISADIDHFSKKYTINPKEISVKSYVDHSKLKQIYYDVDQGLKFSLLVHLLKNEKSGLVMVFCGTRRNVDFVVMNLRNLKINADAIHGGMAQNKRINVLNDFHNKGAQILVCTDVAARGLDVKGVSHVYNYDLPKSSNEYIHRIGRTARAETNGMVINLVCSKDYENFGNVLSDKQIKIDQGKTPYIEKIRIIVDDKKGGNFSRGSQRGAPRRDYSKGKSDSHSKGRSDSRQGGYKSQNSTGNRGRSTSRNENSRRSSNDRKGSSSPQRGRSDSRPYGGRRTNVSSVSKRSPSRGSRKSY